MDREALTSGEQFAFTSPAEALDALLARLRPVDDEAVNLEDARGRVLAEPIVADRDSPPCDVSQMDGYAVCLGDLDRSSLEVAGEVMIGRPPPKLPPGKVLRVFTGAPIPAGADVVIPREDVDEQPGRIELATSFKKPQAGRYIRRRGENLRSGQQVVAAGSLITPAITSALASFGVAQPRVHRRVRVGVIVTGDELRAVDDRPEPWQIRDANGPALYALLSACAWLDVRRPVPVEDKPDRLRVALEGMLDDCDAVLISGGVSMGQYDHVPEVVASSGGRTVFHKLPIRPGKPMLGAVGPQGQAILGLPGNPVSVLVTTRRLAAAALRRLAGFGDPAPPVPVTMLTNGDGQTLGLWWYRPVRLTGAGQVELVPTRGSGDMVSAARSDGFVEIPPGADGAGPWPYYRWAL